MRSMRRYQGRAALVITETGDYRGTILRATRDGLDLAGVSVTVNGQDTPLEGVVVIPAGQVVHVQVADS